MPATLEGKRWGLALLDGSVALITLTLITELIDLPAIPAPGIVSTVIRSGHEPLTNYLRFLVIFCGTFIAFANAASSGRPLFIRPFVKPFFLLITRPRTSAALLWGLLGATILVVLINLTARSTTDLSLPLDTFHEGEYVGFRPAAVRENPFEATFLIHGFGIDALPSVLAEYFVQGERHILFTRLVNKAFQALSYITALVVIVLASQLGYKGAASYLCTASLGLLGMLALGRTLVVENKDLVFLFQVALILAFVATAQVNRWRAVVISTFLGATTPLAFLYTYDRALYAAAAIVLITPCLLLIGRAVFTRWLVGIISGVALGAGAALLITGPGGAEAVIEQVLYWGKYGRSIWAKPLNSLLFILTAGPAVLIQCLVLTYLWREHRRAGGLRAVLSANAGIIVLLIVALLFMRVALDRSDPDHMVTGAMPSWLLGIVIACRAAQNSLSGASDATQRYLFKNNHLGAILLSAAVAVLIVQGWLARAGTVLYHYAKSYKGSDSQVVRPDYLEAVSAIKEQVQTSTCFFTMTSEGVWYHFFDRPSCSRFHQLIYARSVIAQEELITALKREKPATILFSNSMWSNNFDGTSVFNSNAPVAKYVMSAYQPFLLVGNHWFWSLSETPSEFTTSKAGEVGFAPADAMPAHDLVVSGTLFPSFVSDLKKLIVFVSVGTDNTLIWAGRNVSTINGKPTWTATVPTASLDKGENLLRFWVTQGSGKQLHPIGADVRVNVR